MYSPDEYGWMGPEHAAIKRDFLPEDLAPHLAELGFDASVAVQARQTIEETRWLLELAEGRSTIAGVVDPWAGPIRELGRRENVFCKLSGMVTEADVSAWRPADFAPYIDVVLEAFGPSRLMIGSDWPVCTLGGSYEAVMRIVLDAVGRLGRAEQDAICGGTCRRFYSL